MGLEIKFIERELHPIMYIIVPLGAFSLAFLCGGVLMSWAGVNPISGYEAFISGAIGSPVKFADTLVRTTSFLLMGVGLAFALRARVFNIGAEGQYIMGAIVGTWVALLLQENLPPPITIIASLTMAMIIGGLWAGFAGYLKATLGINEVVL
ncbi:MAG: ABC transporter permease, partial [Thermoprotei archaeon]